MKEILLSQAMIERVFFLKYGEDNIGTGFTYEKEEVQYLVTSRHLFEDDDNENKINNSDRLLIEYKKGKDWIELNGTAFLHENPEIDILVLFLENPMGPFPKMNYHPKKVYLGQQAIFLGFPYGNHTIDNGRINKSFPFPFIKNSIVSSVETTPENGTLYFLDGHTNPGFSGGPVLILDYETNQLSIIGVMRGYLKQEGTIDASFYDAAGNFIEDELSYDENSGIVICSSIEHAFEILSQNGK